MAAAAPATTVLRRGNAIVQATWTPPDTLDVFVTDGHHAWRTVAASAQLQPFIDGAGLGKAEYFRLTRTAFMRERDGGLMFGVAVHTASEPARIEWHFEQQDAVAGKIKVRLGDLPLHREPDERGQRAVLKLLSALAQDKEEFQALYEQMAQQYRDAEAQRAAALAELRDAVAKCQTQEETQCTKFVQLLNHKKRKIRTLMDAIKNDGTVQLGDDVYVIKAQQIPLDGAQTAAGAQGADAVASPGHSDEEPSTPPGPAGRAAPPAAAAGPSQRPVAAATARPSLPVPPLPAPAAVPVAAAARTSTSAAPVPREAAPEIPPEIARTTAEDAMRALLGPSDGPVPAITRRKRPRAEADGPTAGGAAGTEQRGLASRSSSVVGGRTRGATNVSIDELIGNI